MLVHRRTPLHVCTFSTAVWCVFNRPCRPVLEICTYKYYTALVQLLKGTVAHPKPPVVQYRFGFCWIIERLGETTFGVWLECKRLSDNGSTHLTGRLESAAAVIVHHTTNWTFGQQLCKRPVRHCTRGVVSTLTCGSLGLRMQDWPQGSRRCFLAQSCSRRTQKCRRAARRPIMDLVSFVAGHGGPSGLLGQVLIYYSMLDVWNKSTRWRWNDYFHLKTS